METKWNNLCDSEGGLSIKTKLKRVLILLLAVCLFLQIPTALTFGDFDSDSDYGGYDSDYDSDSDYSWGSDSDYSGSSGGRGSESDSAFWAFVGWVFVLVSIIAFIKFAISAGMTTSSQSSTGTNTSRSSRYRITRSRYSADRKLQPMELFYQKYPAAKSCDLRAFVRKLFNDMQKGWEAGNIENVQARFVPDTWNGFNNQLMAKNARGETAHVRHILLEEIEPLGWFSTRLGQDEVTLTFLAYSNIWTTDRSGKIISGSETRRLEQYFEWTLVWTDHAGGETPCPNCGNKLDASAYAVCPFCGTELPQKGGWLLKHIEALSQATIHE